MTSAAIQRRSYIATAILAIAVYGLFFSGKVPPMYWEFFSFGDSPPLPSGIDEGLPWMGAENPALVVHEYFDYECPHCHRAHRKLRRRLDDYPNRLRIVRHDYARMACAPNDATRRLPRCSMARAAYCAGQESRYWEWNDYVLAAPKPLSGDSRKNYELEVAAKLGFEPRAFDACMFAPDTIENLDSIFRDARKKGIKETPYYIVNGKRVTLKGALAIIEASMR